MNEITKHPGIEGVVWRCLDTTDSQHGFVLLPDGVGREVRATTSLCNLLHPLDAENKLPVVMLYCPTCVREARKLEVS